MKVPLWGTRALLVDPNVLQEENVLRIESTVTDEYHNTYQDRFTIDNILIHFKIRTEHSQPVGPAKG